MDNLAQKSNIALDLDALAPKAAQITIGGKVIDVAPTDLQQYAKLLDLSSEMQKLKDSEDPALIMPLYEKLRTVINELIPELADANLNLPQITAVFNLLVTINSPGDKTLTELKARGIEVKGGNSDPKDLTSSEQSPDSSEPTTPR